MNNRLARYYPTTLVNKLLSALMHDEYKGQRLRKAFSAVLHAERGELKKQQQKKKK